MYFIIAFKMKRSIGTRADIELLVDTFYQKVRADQQIGDIFNQAIDDWEAHLKLLSDFWETNLLFVARYKGHPPSVHMKVDQQQNYGITQAHFDQWIVLWHQTIDELFEGELAEMAKSRAQNIATVLLSRMQMARSA